MRKARFAAVAWGVCVALLILFLVNHTQSQRVFESNILALLPSDEYDANRSQAITRFSDNLSARVLFLIGATDLNTAQSAAIRFHDLLLKSGLFEDLSLQVSDELQQKLASQHYPFRSGLLTHDQRRLLKSGDHETLWTETLRKLSGPATASFSTQMTNDPLLLFPDFLQQNIKSSGELINNMFVVKSDDINYVLIDGTLRFNPFSIAEQQQFDDVVKDSLQLMSQSDAKTHILHSGVIFHAISGTQRAMSDISTIGLGSLIGILALIVGTFRSAYPVALSILSISCGIIAGITTCLLLFNQVHIFTLIFGSSLIGVSIDYAFHYFADAMGANQLSPREIISNIFPGILLGMLTSCIGYIMLIFTDFPGLKQIAIFSVTGLIASWLCVVLWFPLFKTAKDHGKSVLIARFSQFLIQMWDTNSFRKSILSISLILTPLIILSIVKLDFNDDIRILQQPSALQQQHDQNIRNILAKQDQFNYLLIKGNDPQKVLEREEQLIETLDQLKHSRQLQDFHATSRLFPSIHWQKESQILLQQALLEGSSLFQYLTAVGLDAETIVKYRSNLQNPDNHYLNVLQLHQFESRKSIGHLWLGNISGEYYSVILLENLQQITLLDSLLTAHPEVSLVDQASEISTLFSQYRVRSIELIITAYILIFVLLLFRYRPLKALTVILPPVFASLCAISVAAYFTAPINIFHIFAIIMILAIGIDYTLFFAERDTHRSTTMMAISLSAATTILSFGLLALSDTRAIHSFGLTLMIGIAISFILSPFVGAKTQPQIKGGHDHIKTS